MLSPFPGMDAYLENPEIFPDLRHSYLVYLTEFLQPLLPLPYLCDIRHRTWIELPHDEELDPFVELFVGSRPSHRAVTVIEVLSPAVKSETPRRLSYLGSRRQLPDASQNLIEIDFLRNGKAARAVADQIPAKVNFDYSVTVQHWNRPDRLQFYPILLQQRLPIISIPLDPEDDCVPLDLQAVFNRCYDAGPYAREIDYRRDRPEPPLSDEQQAWASELLKQKSV
jgi:hypothetical protein